MKSKIIRAEPIEPLSAAYMKQLRAYNRTKKSYDSINPYAEVYQFRDNVYGIYTDNADGGGAPWIYLIIGSEKAMLIDTGFGIGDLKGLVNHLTGNMPLIVVNTHTHPDHAYGNFQFDAVYCHEYAVPYLQKQLRADLWDSLFDETGAPFWLSFDRADIIPYREYEIIGCKSHHIFQLGEGHEVELIFFGGHDAGNAGFLDHKNRILFCGDAFLSMWVIVNGPKPDMPFSEFASVNAFTMQLEELVTRLDAFDVLFPGHFIVDIENSVVPNMLAVCHAVLERPDKYDYCIERKGKTTKFKLINGLGALAYTDAAILKP